MFHVNPVERPYFWCGGDDVGLMGGSDTRRGWHLRDKAKGLQVVHQDKTVTLNLNLVDTPLLLKAAAQSGILSSADTGQTEKYGNARYPRP